mmetsp:Transcript_13990/g.25250  ORF Transcript_13990/g.25250 Transcript_13990/m.25250 type:complete len:177 (+) Transcript_13990:291-821(+)
MQNKIFQKILQSKHLAAFIPQRKAFIINMEGRWKIGKFGNHSLAAPNHDSPDNKSLHIYFNHQGLVFFSPLQKRPVEKLLETVWSHFGTVTDTYYHNEFSFGFVTYANHDQAELALSGLKDSACLRRAIDAAVRHSSDPMTAQNLADQLFVPGHGGMILPSWAAPRKRGSRGATAF